MGFEGEFIIIRFLVVILSFMIEETSFYVYIYNVNRRVVFLIVRGVICSVLVLVEFGSVGF